jgi:Domain of unknown function (DUF4450)
MRIKQFIAHAWLMLFMPFITVAQSPTRYSASGNAITVFNGGLYNNRPLYCNNTNAFILTGDKPLIRFAQTPYVYGSFMLGIVRDNKLKWATDCSSVKTTYRGNMMEWMIEDKSLNSFTVKLSVIPAAGAVGMCIRAQIQYKQPGDKLVWIYGGAEYSNETSLSWSMDVVSRPAIMNESFQPISCKGNLVNLNEAKFVISPITDTSGKSVKIVNIEGACSDNSKMELVDAAEILKTAQGKYAGNPLLPIVSAAIDLNRSGEKFTGQ